MISQLRAYWRQLSPLSRGLCVFLLFNAVVLNLFLAALPWTRNHTTTIQHTVGFVIGYTSDDSWSRMRPAYVQVRHDPQTPLYQEIFFRQHIKFHYPPTSLLVYWALDHLPFGGVENTMLLSIVSWLAVAATALFVSLVFQCAVREHLGEATDHADGVADWLLPATFTLTFYPIVKAFTLGQIQTWLNLLFAVVLWLWMRGRDGGAGAVSGLMCLIKPQYGVLLLWGILRARWRFSLAFLVVALLIGAASISVFGLVSHVDYVRHLSYISAHGETLFANQTVNGLLNRLLFNGDSLGWRDSAYAPFNPWVYAGTVTSSAGLILLGLFWRRGEHQPASSTDLMIATLTLTMASPVALEHHYGVLMPMYAAMLPALLRRPVMGAHTLAFLGVSYVLSSNLLRVVDHAADTAFNLVQSYQFFGAIVVLVCLYKLRHAQAPPVAAAARLLAQSASTSTVS